MIIEAFTILLLGIFKLGLSIEIKTGQGALYTHEQYVSVGYVSIGQQASLYYQFFKTPNPAYKDKKKVTFYLGNSVSDSAQSSGFMGYIPYHLKLNTTSQIGLTLTYNEQSLNSITNLCIADMTRGAGFSSNFAGNVMSYEVIASDIGEFIKGFFEQEQIPKDTKIVIYASYEMVRATVMFANLEDSPAVDLILENPWLGYSSFSQLYYQLPAYGDTSREGLDMISNNIYSLQSSDYGKDLDEMTRSLNQMKDYITKSVPFNSENPIYDQGLASNLKEGINFFFSDCKTCRAYCSLQKSEWTGNMTIRANMKKDILFDISRTLVDDLSTIKGKTLIIQSKLSLYSTLQPLIEVNPNFIHSAPQQVNGDIKYELRYMSKSGFWPFLDEPESMLSEIKTWLYKEE